MLETILEKNLNSVRDRISAAAKQSGREPGAITLVAVTKRTPAEWARLLVRANQLDLGENYPQELWAKSDSLQDLQSIRWHAIGHLQTNKLRRTLPLVTMIHAVDSLKLLTEVARLNSLAPKLESICLQVNLSGEQTKHGWTAETIHHDIDQIARIVSEHNLPVNGLMTMAALGTDALSARPAFAALRELSVRLSQKTGLPLKNLSMGMSGDFEAAIIEGATHVRVGSALFEGVPS